MTRKFENVRYQKNIFSEKNTAPNKKIKKTDHTQKAVEAVHLPFSREFWTFLQKIQIMVINFAEKNSF